MTTISAEERIAMRDSFARLLEHHGLDLLEKGRSRFRSYLLGALKHYISDRIDKERAEKRGGGKEYVPLDGTNDEDAVDPPDQRSLTPEAEFDRQWALTVLDSALEAVREEHIAENKEELFEVLKPWLTGEVEGTTQAEAAARLGGESRRLDCAHRSVA